MSSRLCPKCNRRHLDWDARSQSWLCKTTGCNHSEPSHKPAPPAALGRAITAIRERIGETPDEMAGKLNMEPDQLASLESGDSRADASDVERFRYVYGVDLWVASWCMFGDNSKLPKGVQRPAAALMAILDQDMAEFFDSKGAAS